MIFGFDPELGPLANLLSLAAITFLISVALTPIARDVFRAYNLMDKPGARKMHRHPVPRVGGIPVAVAYCYAMLQMMSDPLSEAPAAVEQLFPATVVIFLVGLVDDMLTLTPWVKLAGQIAAAGVAFWSGLRIDALLGFELPLLLSGAFTFGWLLLCTNALNLIDGLDGLCGGMGTIASLVFCLAGWIAGLPDLALVALPLAAALFGFLFHNFNPATVFLGDSGALTIGFLLGCFGIVWNQGRGGALGLALPLLALAIPLLDLGISIVRRFIAGRPIFGADRGHMHHRLLDLGLNTRRAVLTLYAIAASAGAIALLLASRDSAAWWVWLLGSWVVFLGVVVWRLRYVEFETLAEFIRARGWKSGIAAHRHLRACGRSLRKATCEEELWQALSKLSAAMGWAQVSWLPTGAPAPPAAAPASWLVRAPVDGGADLIVEGLDGARKPGPRTLTLLSDMIAVPLRRRSGWLRVAQTA